MPKAALPANEVDRLQRLRLYDILDTPPEAAFDRITRIVSATIGVPIALVSLVDQERQWFKSHHGIDATETPRDWAFCGHAILDDKVLVVEDATKDARFADNPLVLEAPSIRFYAGAPLETADGLRLGTLCAIDSQPRQLSGPHRQLLEDLAHLVIDEMELRLGLRRALEMAAEQSRLRAAHDDFLNMVSHELRTPLTSINGTFGLLAGGLGGDLPEKATQLLTIARRNSDSLLLLINDLLDIQKIDAGEFEYEFGVVSIDALVAELAENMSGLRADDKVTIDLDLVGGDLPAIPADEARLKQAITNLLSNALKFSPKGGRIMLSAKVVSDAIEIAVADQGPGIPESFLPRLFERFAQAPGPEKVKGSGLGLAIAKAIIDAHGGSIDLETGPASGTTFKVTLPIRQTLTRAVH